MTNYLRQLELGIDVVVTLDKKGLCFQSELNCISSDFQKFLVFVATRRGRRRL